MKKKLTRSGSGWALFMPKTLLELIEVNPETGPAPDTETTNELS